MLSIQLCKITYFINSSYNISENIQGIYTIYKEGYVNIIVDVICPGRQFRDSLIKMFC